MRPEEAVRVEQKSNGRIKRWHLRRSDWHLIWPELIGAVGAPTIVTCDVNEPTQQAQAAINHDVQGVVHG